MFGWLKSSLFGDPRSGSWPRVRKEHLKHEPLCIACGRKNRPVDVHHILGFAEHPDRELDPTNLCTLCDPCHFVFGHLMDWKRTNEFVLEDSRRYMARRVAFGSNDDN